MVGGPARNSNYVKRHSAHVGARPIAMDAAKLRTKAMCTAPSVIIGCAHRQHDVRRIHVSQTIRPKGHEERVCPAGARHEGVQAPLLRACPLPALGRHRLRCHSKPDGRGTRPSGTSARRRTTLRTSMASRGATRPSTSSLAVPTSTPSGSRRHTTPTFTSCVRP